MDRIFLNHTRIPTYHFESQFISTLLKSKLCVIIMNYIIVTIKVKQNIISLYICMYVHMYVCTYVYVYFHVCMYVSLKVAIKMCAL